MAVQLTPPLLALPIVEFASYFLVITQLKKYLMKKKLKMLKDQKIKNFVSSTSLYERTILDLQDDLLSKTMIVTCLFGIIILVISCYIKKTFKLEYIDTAYNDSLQTHLFFTFALTIFALYLFPAKVGFYIYTFGITLSLLLYVLLLLNIFIKKKFSLTLFNIGLTSKVNLEVLYSFQGVFLH